MDVLSESDAAAARIAAAIGEPARARMLYCLSDNRARTSTELALVAGVSPSTASTHLQQLRARHLVRVHAQGKHRYYSLDGRDVARVLEALTVLAGRPRAGFVPTTPGRLRAARTCYDHLAGSLGVALLDRLTTLGWVAAAPAAGGSRSDAARRITPKGERGFATLGIDVGALRRSRRRRACDCLDWSERRPHLGGALGAALLDVLLVRHWVRRERDDRAVVVTALGERELSARFGLRMPGARA